ncbi:hypothetical protein PSTT_15228 [Puccinia striiformis]|uniref:Uncharacterized protein n=1 Tax=Puccinia striiformis TaxID=27350 RepID=A0A2S4UJ04_9BASI|nr:hypothetical protein PSTT_15228 [Puccinia striiformis]
MVRSACQEEARASSRFTSDFGDSCEFVRGILGGRSPSFDPDEFGKDQYSTGQREPKDPSSRVWDQL